MRKTNISETCKILQSTHSQATAKIHVDKLLSDELSVNRGARQVDPLSPKLFIAVMEKVFKKADSSERFTVDGENLTNLRFADDVALFNELPSPPPPTPSKQMKKKTPKHSNSLNSDSLQVSLKIHKEKKKNT